MSNNSPSKITPVVIVGLYLLAGAAWTYLDHITLADGKEYGANAQIHLLLAGVFIVATAVALFWLLTAHNHSLRTLRENLETRLQDRTAALRAINEQLQQEVSHRTRTEEALRKSEKRYRSVVETQTELICHFKADGTLSFVNTAYCRYFGKSPGELIGRKFLTLIPSEDLVTVTQAIAALGPDNPSITLEHRAMKPNGELAWQQWTNSVITDTNGRVTELQGVGRDISERKLADDKLRRLSTELAQATQMSTLGEMSKSLAHELNQPLTAIVTYTQACLDLVRAGKIQDDELIHTMEQVASQGLRAGEIIRRMRRFTQTRVSRPGTVDIGVLINEVITLVAWEARQQQVHINLELPEDLPPVSTDAIQIQQVLLNLLNHAIATLSKQPEERNITLRVCSTESNTLEITVADTGPTMPESVLNRQLLDDTPIAREDSPTLNLALSRSLIEAQRGRLWATRNPGRGTTYHFTLPLTTGINRI